MKGIIIIIQFIILSASFFCFSQTDEVILSGNSKLHFKTFGTGNPILIINGGPGMNCEGFGIVAQELAKMNFKTIIYDQRGTGKSTLVSANNETITMDLMVQDIENLRNYLKITKWTILGHSFGGILATYYASKHPEYIDKLIFSSSGGINMNFTSYVHTRLTNNLTSSQRDSLQIYQTKLDRGDSSIETLKLRAKYLANAYVYNKTKASIIAERLTQTKFEINSLVFQNLKKIKYDCSKSFSNFNNPVLILQGKNDIITTETAQEIAKAFTNSKLILMDNCGHYGWLDAEEIYYKSIKEFLNLEN